MAGARRGMGWLAGLLLWCLAPGTVLSLLLAGGVWLLDPWTQDRLAPLVAHPVTFSRTANSQDPLTIRAHTRDFAVSPLAELRFHWWYEREPSPGGGPSWVRRVGALDIRSGWPASSLRGRVLVPDVIDVRIDQPWFPIPAGASAAPPLALHDGTLVLRGRPQAFVRRPAVGPWRGDPVLVPTGVDLVGASVNAAVATVAVAALVICLRALRHCRRCAAGRCGRCGHRRVFLGSIAQTSDIAQTPAHGRPGWRGRWARRGAPALAALVVAVAIGPLLAALPIVWIDDDPLGVRTESVAIDGVGHGTTEWAPPTLSPWKGPDPVDVDALRAMLAWPADAALPPPMVADEGGRSPRRSWWVFRRPASPPTDAAEVVDEEDDRITLACTSFGWPAAMLQRVGASAERRCAFDVEGRPTASPDWVRWRVRWSAYWSNALWLSPAAIPLAWLLWVIGASVAGVLWWCTAGRRTTPWTCPECGTVSRARSTG